MGHRVLQIKNYKNIGFQSKEELLLNSSTSNGEMGGLVVLIGPNNSGKTNVLSALTAMNDKNIKPFNDFDLPDFDVSSSELEVSIVYYESNETFGFNKTYSAKKSDNSFFYREQGKQQFVLKEELLSTNAKGFVTTYIQSAYNSINRNYNSINRNYNSQPDNTIINNTALSIVQNQTFKGNEEIIYKTLKAMSIHPNIGYNYVKNNINAGLSEEDMNKLIEEFNIANRKGITIESVEKDKGYSILPSIIPFNPLNFKNNQLQVSPDKLANSELYKLVFKAIDFDINDLLNTYKRVKEQNMPALLKKTCLIINEKLNDLSTQFNKLFQSNRNKYKFEITLETTSIFLTINLNDTPLHLDKQSTGFKWFFEFYFTLIARNGLKRGDIIVMDEPATNLHPSGITELRKFIKKFAESNELTFVISTHNPFFIDLDYLEEVRVVNRIGDNSVIQSKFHFVDDDENDDTDSLRPIKDALTVPRHVLVNPHTPTIFVEGITDYLYLTAFAQLLKVKDYVFLPIQGLSKKNLFELLSKIEKKPIILVDGDKAGKEIKTKAEAAKYSNIEIIMLSDIDPKFITIESLFDPLDKMEKSFNLAATFKYRVLNKGKISKTTKDNFQKLLTNITS